MEAPLPPADSPADPARSSAEGEKHEERNKRKSDMLPLLSKRLRMQLSAHVVFSVWCACASPIRSHSPPGRGRNARTRNRVLHLRTQRRWPSPLGTRLEHLGKKSGMWFPGCQR